MKNKFRVLYSFWIGILILGGISLFGSGFLIDENKNVEPLGSTEINCSSGQQIGSSSDLEFLSPGESACFKVTNGSGSNTFQTEVTFSSITSVNNNQDWSYSIQVKLKNIGTNTINEGWMETYNADSPGFDINYSPSELAATSIVTDNLHGMIQIRNRDIGDGVLTTSDPVETFVWNFTASKSTNISLVLGTQTGGILPPIVWGEYINLLDFEKPKVENINVQKNGNDSSHVDVSWTYGGTKSTITNVVLKEGGGGPTHNVTYNENGNSVSINNLVPNTTYSGWTIELSYDTGFNLPDQTLVFSVPTFTTFPQDLNNSFDTSYSNITSDSVDVNWSLNGITGSGLIFDQVIITGKDLETGFSYQFQNDLGQPGISVDENGSFTITGLEDGTVYDDWQAEIFFHQGSSTYSFTTSMPTFDTLIDIQAPTIVSTNVNNITSTSAQINWNINDSYNAISDIKIKNASGTIIASGNTNLISSYPIEGLDPSTTYSGWTIEVDWVDELNQTFSVSQPIEEFTTLTPITEPTINEINVSDITSDSVVISWDVNDVDASISNIILRDDQGNVIQSGSSDSQGTYVVSDLDPGTTYSGWILEIKWVDELSNNNSIIQTIDDFTTLIPIIAPTINDTSVSNITSTSVQINWDIIDQDESISDVILKDNQGNVIQSGSTLATGSCQVNDLNSSTTYSGWTIEVNWIDELGNTNTIFNDIDSFTTLTPIIEPTINDVNVSNIGITSVQINWSIDDPDNAISNIAVKDENGNVIASGNNQESGNYQIDNLQSGHTYEGWMLEVTWINEVGEEQITNQTIPLFTTIDDINAPTINSVDVSNITTESVQVNWDITDTNGAVTNIVLKDENQTMIQSESTNLNGSYIVNGLDSGTTYSGWTLEVEWVDGFGTNQISSQAINSFTTIADIQEPEVLNINTSGITTESVQINWSIDDPDNAINNIVLKDESGAILANGSNEANGSYQINNLEDNQTYNGWTLEINWIDGYGDSFSIIESVPSFNTVQNVTPPTINSINVSNITTNSATINWNISDLDGSASNITLKDQNGSVIQSDSNELIGSYQVNDLNSNTIYEGWTLEVNWVDGYGVNQIQTQQIESFQTEAIGLEIQETSITNVTHNSATINWDIVLNDDQSIEEISIINGTQIINTDSTSLVDSYTLTNLSPDTTYEDLSISVTWIDANGTLNTLNQPLEDITTEYEELGINSLQQSINEESGTITISWDIVSNDSIIDDIQILDENGNIVMNGSNREQGSYSIEIESEVTYNWSFNVIYHSPSGQENSNQMQLESFSYENPEPPVVVPPIVNPPNTTSQKMSWGMIGEIGILLLLFVTSTTLLIMYIHLNRKHRREEKEEK